MPNPAAHNPTLDAFHERLLADSAATRLVQPPARAPHIRRRATLQQGRALETLGHAVEYLMDSGMFRPNPADPGNQAAIQILMRASRAVFEDCAEVLPLSRRLGRWGNRVVARALGQAAPPC